MGFILVVGNRFHVEHKNVDNYLQDLKGALK